MRIISLIPSSTEIVCALGFGKHLVGRSHECDYPPEVEKLPVCSRPKINIQATSCQIDLEVRALLKKSSSVYEVNVNRLKILKPDLIITQDQCEVCAVSLKDVQNALCDWRGTQPKIVTLRSNTLMDVWEGIDKVAQALGQPDKGKRLVKEYQTRIETISKKAKKLGKKLKVACLEWFDPLMIAGNWVPQFVLKLGGESLFGKSGYASHSIPLRSLIKEDPDCIITMPCGWDMERSLQEITVLTKKKEWPKLKAVGEGWVYLTDGNQYFNRPGPRLVESFEILAEIMYPESFCFGHQGKAWRKWE